jgi:hypothetical protein
MMERGQTTWSSEPLLPWRVVLCVLLEHMIIDPLSAACSLPFLVAAHANVPACVRVFGWRVTCVGGLETL